VEVLGSSVSRRAAGRLLLAVLIAAASGACPCGETPTEYEVKAAFILNFARFVEWPDAAPAGATGVLTIGILGKDPFEGALERVVENKMVGARKLAVVHVDGIELMKPVQILFISRSESGRLEEVLTKLRGAPVLTVGDMEHFARDGGVINFILEDGRIRFEINPAAARSAGLRLSSKLLRVAKVITPEGEVR